MNIINFTRNNDLSAIQAYSFLDDFDVNFVDGDNYTSLHIASELGFSEIVDFLLTFIGVDLETKSTSHGSASINGHLDIVKSLIRAGAQVDACDSHGCTPLAAASIFGHSDVVSELISAGSSVNQDGEVYYTSIITHPNL